MRRLLLALPVLALACSGLGLNSPDTPEEVFETAEVAYTSALESAMGYVRTCNAEPVPTERCDEFTVMMRDTNSKAQNYLFLGGMLAAGVSNCDEVVEPGCTGRQLRVLAYQLQELAIFLASKEAQ